MRFFICLAMLLACVAAGAQTKTVQERLGYPANTKLLIIHADDLGVTQAENAASIKALEKGSVNSGSIMVPCPWFPEIASYAAKHPTADLGLHLVLTSEWKNYKWGPVLHDHVKSLITDQGYLTDGSVDLTKVATSADVENELRAQVKRAIQFGIDPTHFDSHMGMLFRSEDFLRIYINLGREFKVPVLLSKEMDAYFSTDLKKTFTDKDIFVDHIYTATPPDFAGGMNKYYGKILTSMQTGLNVILLHAAYDNDEMKAVAVDHPDWGSAWRQADFDFFTSAQCSKLLQDQNIKLVTWREIRDKLVRQ